MGGSREGEAGRSKGRREEEGKRERGGGSHCFCLQHSVLSPQLLMFLSFSKKMWEFYEFKLRV